MTLFKRGRHAVVKITAAFLMAINVFIVAVPANAVVIKKAAIMLSISEESEDGITVSAAIDAKSAFPLGGVLFDVKYNKRAFKFQSYLKSQEFLVADVVPLTAANDTYGYIRFAFEPESLSGVMLDGKTELFTVTFRITDEASPMNYSFEALFGESGEMYESDGLMTSVDCEFIGCNYSVSSGLRISNSELEIVERTSYKLRASKNTDGWSSSNSEIASVNSDGVVSGHKEGKCFIYAYTSDEMAFCKVTVKQRTAISADVNKIQKKQYYCKNQPFNVEGLELRVEFDNGESEIVNDGFMCSYDFSTAGLKKIDVKYESVATSVTAVVYDLDPIKSKAYGVNDKYVFNVLQETGLKDFLDLMNNENIYVISDNKILSDGNVATGMVAVIYKDGHTLDEKTISVNGDINCDGFFDIRDLVALKKNLANNDGLSETQTYAANFGKSDVLTSECLVVVRKRLLGFVE